MASEQQPTNDLAPEILTVEEAVKKIEDYLLENQRKKQIELSLPDGYVFVDFCPKDAFVNICEIGQKIPKESRSDFVTKVAEKISWRAPSDNAEKQLFLGLPIIDEQYRVSIVTALGIALEHFPELSEIREQLEEVQKYSDTLRAATREQINIATGRAIQDNTKNES